MHAYNYKISDLKISELLEFQKCWSENCIIMKSVLNQRGKGLPVFKEMLEQHVTVPIPWTKYPATHVTFNNVVIYHNHYGTWALTKFRNLEFCFKDVSDVCLYKSKPEKMG